MKKEDRAFEWFAQFVLAGVFLLIALFLQTISGDNSHGNSKRT
jgi:hypothetical protein